ncbi:MAG: hypothetical protein QXR26_00225 [Candidatus Caldarchaeum sp.]
MKALLDTSFLLLCLEKGRDYLKLIEQKLGEHVEPVILENVVDELRTLASKRGKKGMLARAALQKMINANIVQFHGMYNVDEALQKYAAEHKMPVITVDTKLAKKLASSGLPYISVGKAGKPIVRLILR